MPAERLPSIGLRALLLTCVVAYVLLFGLLLYQLMAAGGAVARLGASLAAMPGDRAAPALLLTLPVGAFVEAVSGFGVSIVVVAPLLVAIGFPPGRAALLGLLTQNAVPWGALAVGVVLSGQIASRPPEAIGVGCALLSAPAFLYFALLALWLAGGPAALRAHLALGLVVGALLAVGVLLATLAFGVELGMVVGAPPALLVGLLWLRRAAPGAALTPLPWPDTARGGDSSPVAHHPSLPRALAPYALLVAVLLSTRLLAPLREWLQLQAVVALPGAGPTLPLLYSPGFPLLIGCLATVPLLGLRRAEVAGALARTARQWTRASAALLAFMSLSELMLRSGMTDRLASATASRARPGLRAGRAGAGGAERLPDRLERGRRRDDAAVPDSRRRGARRAAPDPGRRAERRRRQRLAGVAAAGRPGCHHHGRASRRERARAGRARDRARRARADHARAASLAGGVLSAVADRPGRAVEAASAVLASDRLWNAYSLADLEPPWRDYSRCAVAEQEGGPARSP